MTITTPVHILSRSNNNPSNPIIEKVSDNQPNDKPPSTSLPSKGNVVEPPKVDLGETADHNPSPKKEKNIENIENREYTTVRNPKAQTEKPFNLETEVGKLKIVVPLSELAKHDAYQNQINRSLKIT